jgi:hypothetical protein
VLLSNCGRWPAFAKLAEWTARVLAFLRRAEPDGVAPKLGYHFIESANSELLALLSFFMMSQAGGPSFAP